jgi:hypothetical protein
MRANLKSTLIGAIGIAIAGAAFFAGRAWAGGIPSSGALTYSGVLQDVSGAPLTGTQFVEIKFWNDPTASAAANLLCDSGTPASVSLEVGHFSIGLPDTCSTQVGLNKNIWAEVIVGPTAVAAASLGRAKLGAVPFAIEANHAVSADSAVNATNATNATNAVDATHATNADSATTAATASAAAGDLKTAVDRIVTFTGWTHDTTLNAVYDVSFAPVVPQTTFANWRRIGDSIDIQIGTTFTGAPTPGPTIVFSLPTGVTVDGTAMERGGPYGTAVVAGPGGNEICYPYGNADLAHLSIVCRNGRLTSTNSINLESGSAVVIRASFPVQGWTVSN